MNKRFLEVMVSVLLIALFLGVFYYGIQKRRSVMGPDLVQRLLETPAPTERIPAEAESGENYAQLRVESESLEAEAREAREAGRGEVAIETLTSALVLQERINREDAGSVHADRRRVASLRREIANWEAEPLHEEMLSLQQSGRLALDRNDYAEAGEVFEEALALAREINERHTRSRFYDPTMTRNLERALQQAQISPLLTEQENLLGEARAAAAEEEFAQVREKMQEALALQGEIEERFGEHPSAAGQNRENLLRDKDILLGRVMNDQFENRWQAMQAAFAERDFATGERISGEVFGLYDVLRLDFPRADFPGPERSAQVDFLREIGQARRDIVKEVWGQVLAVSDHSAKLLAHEVSQSLYERVMGQNPSRNIGPNLPVDSVTYAEAQAFAESLSLLMGLPVRLPTGEEFAAALGDLPAPEDLEDAVWHAENSGGQSRPVGQREPLGDGFYDLLGNVAEWVQTEQEGQAQALGGTYNDPLPALRNLPRQSHSTNFRSRTIGFRIAVEVNDEEGP
ncbi:MAG: formylglycine-generating enzyme family protein [Opitutales bacterium]|nr:formylglycine-generating enzyme family protein [Opitutales bacterium]